MKQIDIPAIDPSLPLYYFPVLVRNKSALVQAARRRGIEIIAWPRSPPIYPIEDAARLPQYGYEPGSCPVADATAGRLVGLPTHRRISARHLARIVELLRDHAA
jgi:dTDP-4-amino-4,6-dideoxygalactose transaminase